MTIVFQLLYLCLCFVAGYFVGGPNLAPIPWRRAGLLGYIASILCGLYINQWKYGYLSILDLISSGIMLAGMLLGYLKSAPDDEGGFFIYPPSNPSLSFLRLVVCGSERNRMPSNIRAFDEKTKVRNYLNTHYQGTEIGSEFYRRRRIIQQAVDDIFSLHYFPNDPISVIWYHRQIREILGAMEKQLKQKTADTPAAAAP